MKTPREVLLQRHRATEPKLDAIREKVVWEGRRVAVPESKVTDKATLPTRHWREFFFSLRWHLAGMGAAWLLIILLNLNIGHSATLASAVPAGKVPSPQIILAALRENRRELLQLIQPVEAREVRPPKLFPRSERHDETLIA